MWPSYTNPQSPRISLSIRSRKAEILQGDREEGGWGGQGGVIYSRGSRETGALSGEGIYERGEANLSAVLISLSASRLWATRG